MKVLVTLNIPEVGIESLKGAGLEVSVWREHHPMSPQELVQRSQQVQALLVTGMDSINKEFLNQCPHLKVISQFGAGYDNIDVVAAREMGMVVGNAPDGMTEATADIAFYLMLAASRKTHYLHQSIIAGDWGFFNPRAHLGVELRGKTLGVFGMGRIGFEMAKRCQGAFDMDVIYCSRKNSLQAEKQLQATKVSFDALLERSDVLSVHCALNEETRGIFNFSVFKKMKRTSLFVNTSRGPVHNQSDLHQALTQGDIMGAGLDVTDPEPMAEDDPLLFMENVAITPHIGSATVEARNSMSLQAARNIIQFHRGERVVNRVN